MSTAAASRFKEPFTHLDQFYVSCLWLAYNFQWGAILFIVLPMQVEAAVGAAQKEAVLGQILPLGAILSLIITPITGALSDRSRNPKGKRRPYLVVGALINCAALLVLGASGQGTSAWILAIGFMGAQLGCNWWGGPYAGLIPDVVPPKLHGRASGWQALMTALGLILGSLAGGFLVRGSNFWPVYLCIIGVQLITLALTLYGVREPKPVGAAEPFRLGPFMRSFVLDPKEHRNFYWVLVTRAFVNMGVYAISPYFVYFMGDIILRGDIAARGLNPAQAGEYAGQMTSILMVIIIGMGIPTSLTAGMLSDRTGRKPLVYLSGAVMAIACAIYIGVSFSPSLALTFIVAGIYGIGNGAYQAVDWALALDVLPSGEDAAKDMGVWHVAIVLPQVLAPWISGMVIHAFKSQSLLMGYTTIFAMAAVWFVLGTIFVRQIRGVR
ncbi:MAG: MFS transporter [Armatimonadota bacterium]